MTFLSGQPITHPAWCDRELCTAPEVYPTMASTHYGAHRSATLAEVGYPAKEVYLSELVAPWKCTTHLCVAGKKSIPLEWNSPLVWAILAHVQEEARAYPSLYQIEAEKHGLTWHPLAADDPSLPEPRAVDAGEHKGQEEDAGEPAAVELHAPAPIGSGLRGAPLCGARGSSALSTRDVSCVDCLVILAECEDTAERWRAKLASGSAEELAAEPLPISEELALKEDLTAFPEVVPVQNWWMSCADCTDPDSCYNGDRDCP